MRQLLVIFSMLALSAHALAGGSSGGGGGGVGPRPEMGFIRPDDGDVVRFIDRLPSGEIRFDVAALTNGRLSGIQRFNIAPKDFKTDEKAYLDALRKSAAISLITQANWIAVAESRAQVPETGLDFE